MGNLSFPVHFWLWVHSNATPSPVIPFPRYIIMDTLQVFKIFFIRICKNLSRVPLTHSCVSSLILLKMWGNLKSNILYCCCIYVSNSCYSIYWMFLIGSPCTWSPCLLQSYWGTNFPSPSLPFPVSSNTRITDLLIFFKE